MKEVAGCNIGSTEWCYPFFLMFIALLTGCGRNTTDVQISSSRAETVIETVEKGQAETKESVTETITDTEISTDAPEDYIKTGYTADTKVWDVIDDPVFEGYGRLIFLADRTIDTNQTLREVGSILAYYTYVNTDRTVEIVNYMKTKAEAGEQIFYDIYTDEEKAADPAKLMLMALEAGMGKVDKKSLDQLDLNFFREGILKTHPLKYLFYSIRGVNTPICFH
jgi:hypothetical protein